MNTKVRLRNVMVTMKDWYNAADRREKESLVRALEDHMKNLATCFKCSNPRNKKHCDEIREIESWAKDEGYLS